MESALSLCREGLAVAYLLRFVALLHNQVVERPHRLGELPIRRAVAAAGGAAVISRNAATSLRRAP